MELKAMDLGLMSKHLVTHQGVISKLAAYYCSVQNRTLQQIIYDQMMTMRNHVQVMLQLIEPTGNELVSVDALQQIQSLQVTCTQAMPMSEKYISLEGHDTAKSMAMDNFNSALLMEAENVRRIHVEMAMQQVRIQDRYKKVIASNGWAYAPKSTIEEQHETVQMFKKAYEWLHI